LFCDSKEFTIRKGKGREKIVVRHVDRLGSLERGESKNHAIAGQQCSRKMTEKGDF